ncbi:putative methyltransferase-domain-containing protein [Xylariaceae sp. FL0016]|nr:putative methyltransferase-domain-containing protein [Xylariaceae sp. FL0016]
MSAKCEPSVSMEMIRDTSSSPELSPLAIGEDLAPLQELKAAGTTDFGFSGLLEKPLRLHEDLKSGCGGQLWPAGMVLAKHMLRYHPDLRQSRILEIGSGGGLVGLAVASGCAIASENPLWMTDQLEMLPLMQRNTQANGLEGKVKPAILNWGEPLAGDIVALKPDVILAADCVYHEPAFPLLLATLSDLLALCPTATIYFAYKKRRRAGMQFFKRARKAFHVAEIMEDEDRTVFNREGIFLYAITGKASGFPTTACGASQEAIGDVVKHDHD